MQQVIGLSRICARRRHPQARLSQPPSSGRPQPSALCYATSCFGSVVENTNGRTEQGREWSGGTAIVDRVCSIDSDQHASAHSSSTAAWSHTGRCTGRGFKPGGHQPRNLKGAEVCAAVVSSLLELPPLGPHVRRHSATRQATDLCFLSRSAVHAAQTDSAAQSRDGRTRSYASRSFSVCTSVSEPVHLAAP